eukprot:NODE_1410_length_930_cov_329.767310_g1087_i0.p1 GENE.NODE_1410_length_930_cov_329.767310_g1087_i0~~NODE_1410_length_930_cov_329.767310_g1087_i0.p1  ORF type:complete len:251 (+),score=47.28 NODE_1410_length_930_cov_329.767310_g1087_i0:108-755(+)
MFGGVKVLLFALILLVLLEHACLVQGFRFTSPACSLSQYQVCCDELSEYWRTHRLVGLRAEELSMATPNATQKLVEYAGSLAQQGLLASRILSVKLQCTKANRTRWPSRFCSNMQRITPVRSDVDYLIPVAICGPAGPLCTEERMQVVASQWINCSRYGGAPAAYCPLMQKWDCSTVGVPSEMEKICLNTQRSVIIWSAVQGVFGRCAPLKQPHA